MILRLAVVPALLNPFLHNPFSEVEGCQLRAAGSEANEEGVVHAFHAAVAEMEVREAGETRHSRAEIRAGNGAVFLDEERGDVALRQATPATAGGREKQVLSGVSMATSTRAPEKSPSPSRPEEVPGEAPSMATSALETTTSLLQSFRPLKSFCQHVSTWAHYAQSPGRMIETHHLVARLTEDVLQCIVFDSDQPNARIVGVEYIASEAVFKKLPEEEKCLWHSHYYEICEGLWVNPGVPETMQQQELKKLVKTYGKFWNTWQFDRGDPLPLGPPALMVSPQDHPLGRVPRVLVEERDASLGIEMGEKREQRAALVDKEWAATGKDRAADWWMESGKGWVTEMRAVELESMGMGKGAEEKGGVPSVAIGGGEGLEGKREEGKGTVMGMMGKGATEGREGAKEGKMRGMEKEGMVKMGKERGVGEEEFVLAGRPAQSSKME
ncbi:unnamed protein product [Closterium sp. NIES-54]